QWWLSGWSFHCRVEDVDLAEAGNWTSVAHRVDLGWLPFAVVRRAVQFVSRLAAQPITRVPKIGRARLISDIAQHRAHPALLDFPKGLAAELKIVALLIDRPTAVAVDQDAVVHPFYKLVE